VAVNPYVFIIGCPRSGTTLLQCIVDAHPAIAVAFETHCITRWFEERTGLTPEALVTPGVRTRCSKTVFGCLGALRQGGGSGHQQAHPARARPSRLAHGQEAQGARRDTPGVETLLVDSTLLTVLRPLLRSPKARASQEARG
jgi:hypothetical protein